MLDRFFHTTSVHVAKIGPIASCKPYKEIGTPSLKAVGEKERKRKEKEEEEFFYTASVALAIKGP